MMAPRVKRMVCHPEWPCKHRSGEGCGKRFWRWVWRAATARERGVPREITKGASAGGADKETAPGRSRLARNDYRTRGEVDSSRIGCGPILQSPQQGHFSGTNTVSVAA